MTHRDDPSKATAGCRLPGCRVIFKSITIDTEYTHKQRLRHIWRHWRLQHPREYKTLSKTGPCKTPLFPRNIDMIMHDGGDPLPATYL